MDKLEQIDIDSLGTLRDLKAKLVAESGAAGARETIAAMLQAQSINANTERPVLSQYVPQALSPLEYMRILGGGKEALPILDVSPYPKMRVSASALMRLLVKDKSAVEPMIALSWSEKYKQLSPFGGGIEFTSEAMAELLTRGGGTIENKDIRVKDMPSAHVVEVTEKFLTGEGRESGVECAIREGLEEMADENGVLTPEQVAQIPTPTFMGYGTKLAPDSKGVQTLYLVEICEAVLPDDIAEAFIENIKNMNDVVLVTDAEIQAGKTADGRAIEPLARFLVHPLPALPEIRSGESAMPV